MPVCRCSVGAVGLAANRGQVPSQAGFTLLQPMAGLFQRQLATEPGDQIGQLIVALQQRPQRDAELTEQA